MSSVYDIPLEDVKQFLLANNKSFKNKDDAYDQALILLKDRKAVGHTINIVEWLIAHNLFVNKVNIPNYSIQEIDNMSQSEINKLAKKLTLKGNNPVNIKNILRFLHKLDDISLLPEINANILQILRQLEVQEFDFSTMGFDDVIDLLSSYGNKALIRKLIYDNMERIIFYNTLDINTKYFDTIKRIRKVVTPYESYQRSRYSKSTMLGLIRMNKEAIIKNNTVKQLNNFIDILNKVDLDLIYINMSGLAIFIINLLKSDEFALAKKAFDITMEYDFMNFDNGMSINEYLDYYFVQSSSNADLANKIKKLY